MYRNHSRRLPRKGSQLGGVLVLFLFFAFPVFILAYTGLVLEPGLDLVEHRVDTHQADYQALSLRWECEQYEPEEGGDECKQGAVIDPLTLWSNNYAQNLRGLSDRIMTSALQFITTSGSAQAQESDDCVPPDCITGERRIEGGKVYMEVEVEHSDHKFPNANSRATLIPLKLQAQDLDDGVFRGFTGCQNVTISGNPAIEGGDVYTTDYTTDCPDEDDCKIEINGASADIDSDASADIDSDVLSAATLEGKHLDNISGDEILITADEYVIDSPDKWELHDDVERIYIDGNFLTGEGKENTELKIPNLFVTGEAIFNVSTTIADELKVRGSLTATSEVGEIKFGEVEYGDSCIDDSDSGLCSGGPSDVTFDLPDLGVCDPIGLDQFFPSDSSDEGLEDWTLGSTTELTPDGFSPESDSVPAVTDGYVKVNDFDLKGRLTVRDGPVVIHVVGDFSMTDNGASLDIKDDATLTLMVEGDFTFTGGTIASDSAVVTVDEKTRPQMLVLVDGGDVKIAGNGSMRGSIYAPKSDVEIKGNPSILGSVRGESLRVPGNPSLEYDDDASGSIGGIDQIVGVTESSKPYIVD